MVIDNLNTINFDAQEGNVVNMLRSIESKVDAILNNSFIDITNLDDSWPTMYLDGVADETESFKAILYRANRLGKKIIMPSGTLRLTSTITITDPIEFIMSGDASIVKDHTSYLFTINSGDQVCLALQNISYSSNYLLSLTQANNNFQHLVTLKNIECKAGSSGLINYEPTRYSFTSTQSNNTAYKILHKANIDISNIDVIYNSNWRGLVNFGSSYGSTSSSPYIYYSNNYDVDVSLSDISFTAHSEWTGSSSYSLLFNYPNSSYSYSVCGYNVKLKKFDNIDYGESNFRARYIALIPYNDSLYPIIESLSNKHFVCAGYFYGFSSGSYNYINGSYSQNYIKYVELRNITVDSPSTVCLLNGGNYQGGTSASGYSNSLSLCLAGIIDNIEINADTALLVDSIDAGCKASSLDNKYVNDFVISNIKLNGSSKACITSHLKTMYYSSSNYVYRNNILFENITINSPNSYLFNSESYNYSSSSTGSSSATTEKDTHGMTFKNVYIKDTGTSLHNYFSYTTNGSGTGSYTCPYYIKESDITIDTLFNDISTTSAYYTVFSPSLSPYYSKIDGLDLKIIFNATYTTTSYIFGLFRSSGNATTSYSNMRIYLVTPDKVIMNYEGTSEIRKGAIYNYTTGTTYNNIESNFNPVISILSTDTSTVTSNITYNPDLRW